MRNDWGIPDLSLELQANRLIEPIVGWGAQCRKAAARGTVHFYTEDYRFSALWHSPDRLIRSGCQAAIEPNFSIWEQTPRAVALYQIYRKRWLAQYWQTHGIRIFVDLNVAEFTHKMNFLGVPSGWRAYASHGYVDRLDATEREFELASQHAGTDDLLFVVYGGGQAVGDLCYERGWYWIQERMTAVREQRCPRQPGMVLPQAAGKNVEAAAFSSNPPVVTPE